MTLDLATELPATIPNPLAGAVARLEELPLAFIEDLEAFEAQLGEDLPLLDEGCLQELDDSEELTEELQAPHETSPRADWPRSFEHHLASIRRATRDLDGRRSLSLMGLGDIQRCEEVVAAVHKAWEELGFWAPMLQLGREGFFSAHFKELRGALQLLDAHPAPRRNAALCQRWQAAHDELSDLLPAWCGGQAEA